MLILCFVALSQTNSNATTSHLPFFQNTNNNILTRLLVSFGQNAAVAAHSASAVTLNFATVNA
jgi:hypothetical protein